MSAAHVKVRENAVSQSKINNQIEMFDGWLRVAQAHSPKSLCMWRVEKDTQKSQRGDERKRKFFVFPIRFDFSTSNAQARTTGRQAEGKVENLPSIMCDEIK